MITADSHDRCKIDPQPNMRRLLVRYCVFGVLTPNFGAVVAGAGLPAVGATSNQHPASIGHQASLTTGTEIGGPTVKH